MPCKTATPRRDEIGAPAGQTILEKSVQNSNIKYIALALLIFALWTSPAFCADWMQWGRYRLHTELSLKGAYSDNIFRSPDDEQSDFLTVVSPELSIDAALAPKNYISLHYVGDFEFHSEYDNFKTAHNLGELTWNWLTPRGSRFKVGGNIKDTADQPYSETGRAKDYLLYRAFAHTDLKVGAFTDLGFKYNFDSRRYDDTIDQIDDYNRHTGAVNLVYGYFSQIPLLLEYRFTDQKNQTFDQFSRNFKTNSVFVGARWRGAPRLNGTLRFGYYRSDLEADEFGDSTGFAMDTDLSYRFSDITFFTLTAFRYLNSTTRAERQTGNYYVSEGGTFSIKHHYWERIILTADFRYSRDDYQDTNRLDNYYRFGARAKYLFRDWLSLSLRYRYRRRDSNLAAVDYNENRIQAVLTFSR